MTDIIFGELREVEDKLKRYSHSENSIKLAQAYRLVLAVVADELNHRNSGEAKQ